MTDCINSKVLFSLCCQNNEHEQTTLSKALRITAVVVGVLVALGGTLIILEVPIMADLGTTVGWSLIGGGGAVALIGIFFKCTQGKFSLPLSADAHKSTAQIDLQDESLIDDPVFQSWPGWIRKHVKVPVYQGIENISPISNIQHSVKAPVALIVTTSGTNFLYMKLDIYHERTNQSFETHVLVAKDKNNSLVLYPEAKQRITICGKEISISMFLGFRHFTYSGDGEIGDLINTEVHGDLASDQRTNLAWFLQRLFTKDGLKIGKDAFQNPDPAFGNVKVSIAKA
jgi:hypothetical protein